MDAAESLNSKRLHKLLIGALKVFPMLLAFCELCNTIFSFFGIPILALSFIGGTSFLPLIFLYLASYAFKFCEYHRMFLHYILITHILNVYDFCFGVPVSDRVLFGIHCVIVCVCLFLVLYFHQKEKCCR